MCIRAVSSTNKSGKTPFTTVSQGKPEPFNQALTLYSQQFTDDPLKGPTSGQPWSTTLFLLARSHTVPKVDEHARIAFAKVVAQLSNNQPTHRLSTVELQAHSLFSHSTKAPHGEKFQTSNSTVNVQDTMQSTSQNKGHQIIICPSSLRRRFLALVAVAGLSCFRLPKGFVCAWVSREAI